MFRSVSYLVIMGLSAGLLQQSTCGSSVPENQNRDVEVEDGVVDYDLLQSSARYIFAEGDPNASLEIGDIDIDTILTCDGSPVEYSIDNGTTSDKRDVKLLNIANDGSELCIDIVSTFSLSSYDGAMEGSSFSSSTNMIYAWPDGCSNILPCKQYASFSMREKDGYIVGGSNGAVVPMYMMQSVYSKDYTYLSLGSSKKGTTIEIAYLPSNELTEVVKAASNLVVQQDWIESTYNTKYPFGDTITFTSVNWGLSQGGLETHPVVQISQNSMSSDFVLMHENMHQLRGNLITFQCREDFGTLSEGFVDYELLNVYTHIYGEDARDYYIDYYMQEAYSQASSGKSTVTMMEPGCNDLDMDTIFTAAGLDPYYRVPLAFVEYELTVGREALAKGLQDFTATYISYNGVAVTRDQLFDALELSTGVDPRPDFELWLTNTTWPTDSKVLQAYPFTPTAREARSTTTDSGLELNAPPVEFKHL